jgi:hypothetical protein
VDVSAVRSVGDIDGASATGAGVGVVGGAVFESATGGWVTAAGGIDVAGETQTWLNRMDGGGAPNADVYVQPSTSPSWMR